MQFLGRNPLKIKKKSLKWRIEAKKIRELGKLKLTFQICGPFPVLWLLVMVNSRVVFENPKISRARELEILVFCQRRATHVISLMQVFSYAQSSTKASSYFSFVSWRQRRLLRQQISAFEWRWIIHICKAIATDIL